VTSPEHLPYQGQNPGSFRNLNGQLQEPKGLLESKPEDELKSKLVFKYLPSKISEAAHQCQIPQTWPGSFAKARKHKEAGGSQQTPVLGLKMISHTQKWHCAFGDLECRITGFLQNRFIYLTLL
jgi:hypothetical protein